MTEPTHKTLAEALCAAQGELTNVGLDGTGNFGKYATLPALIEAVRPVLVTHGLSWSTLPSIGEQGQPTMRYQLLHLSGQMLDGEMALCMTRQDAQAQGSALTYARRYALQAVLNIGAEDDDGQSATDKERASSRPQARATPQSAGGNGNGQRLANTKQRGLIFVRAQEHGLSNQQLADIVLAATKSPSKSFDDDDAAGEWLRRAMERLPAAQVNPILEALTA